MKYVVKSVNLTPEDIERLKTFKKKGYSLRKIVELGMEYIELLEVIKKENKEVVRDLSTLKSEIASIISLLKNILTLNDTFVKMQGDLNKFRQEIYNILNKEKAMEYLELYHKCLENINKQLNKLLKTYENKQREILLEKINELDKLRLKIIQKYNLPTLDEDVDRMGILLASLKKLLSDNN